MMNSQCLLFIAFPNRWHCGPTERKRRTQNILRRPKNRNHLLNALLWTVENNRPEFQRSLGKQSPLEVSMRFGFVLGSTTTFVLCMYHLEELSEIKVY